MIWRMSNQGCSFSVPPLPFVPQAQKSEQFFPSENMQKQAPLAADYVQDHKIWKMVLWEIIPPIPAAENKQKRETV